MSLQAYALWMPKHLFFRCRMRSLLGGIPLECQAHVFWAGHCLRLYGNKAEAWPSCHGHGKQSMSVLDAEASVLCMPNTSYCCWEEHACVLCIPVTWQSQLCEEWKRSFRQAYEVCQASALKHAYFACRIPNLLVTHFHTSRSSRVTNTRFTFDRLLDTCRWKNLN